MKATFYTSYASRALARGGQRTLLAVFCIAVGVTAIVGLQLVATSVRHAIISNARAVNQGDLNAGFQSAPLQQSDLTFFDGLKGQGEISAYTAEASSGGIIQSPGGRRTASVRAVDPATFPLLGSKTVLGPGARTLADALSEPGSAVAARQLATDLHLTLGTSFRVLLTNGSVVQLRLTGLAPPDNGVWSGSSVTVSVATWEAASGAPAAYQTVAITTPGDAQTKAVTANIRRQFPLATVRTSEDVLRQADKVVETTRRFLITIGLLALLIGGVGIMNTMQVLLTRRRVEIAVLKTTGYRRRDLYLLFGVEAAALGLAGGAAGGLLGVAVAAGLRTLFVRTFPVVLPLEVDAGTVLGGVAIGLATALIFGLLPIVQAAAIRPQAVLRELPEWRQPASLVQSAGLLLLLSLLFCVLASLILKSLLWGVLLVYGGFVVLALISAGLGAVLWVLGMLPVPDRFTIRYTLLVSGAVVLALGLVALPGLRGVGLLVLVFTLLGYAVVFLPRPWKVNTKLALRNIGRSRGRVTTTLLALLIGVFAVGVILVLGLDLKASLSNALASRLDYNAVAVVPVASRAEVESQLRSLPALLGYRASNFAAAPATAINGQPVAARTDRGGRGFTSRVRRQLRLLSGIQGFELAQSQLPEFVEITSGRSLGPSDSGSDNIIVEDSLRQFPLRLSAGNTVTLKRADSDATETLTIVGFYRLNASGATGSFNVAPIFGSQEAAVRLAGNTPFEIFYLAISPQKVAQATSRLQNLAPDAVVLNLDDFLSQFAQVLGNILIMLTAVASLALLAGIVIVANAVALAMLERRRELGILKAVGYTSGRVLGGVLLENALTAGLGGILGMAPVPLAVAVFNQKAGVHFGVPAPLSIAVVLGVVVLTTATTVLVAWRAVRVRPLSILRYE